MVTIDNGRDDLGRYAETPYRDRRKGRTLWCDMGNHPACPLPSGKIVRDCTCPCHAAKAAQHDEPRPMEEELADLGRAANAAGASRYHAETPAGVRAELAGLSESTVFRIDDERDYYREQEYDERWEE